MVPREWRGMEANPPEKPPARWFSQRIRYGFQPKTLEISPAAVNSTPNMWVHTKSPRESTRVPWPLTLWLRPCPIASTCGTSPGLFMSVRPSYSMPSNFSDCSFGLLLLFYWIFVYLGIPHLLDYWLCFCFGTESILDYVVDLFAETWFYVTCSYILIIRGQDWKMIISGLLGMLCLRAWPMKLEVFLLPGQILESESKAAS